MVYCTSNSLFLLKKLIENGEASRVDTLLQTMEKSIVLIDENQPKNYETQAICEIQKIRFLSLKNMYGLHDNFDLYLEGCIENHKKRIDVFVNSISRNSNFRDFSFDVEMLLEFNWQTKKYGEGMALCDSFIDLLNPLLQNGDMVIKNILEKEIEMIKDCKMFFSLINNEAALQPYDEENNREYWFKTTFYKRFDRRTLFECVSCVKEIEMITDADRDYFEELTKIKLRYY